jgi:hypothetical protein
MMDARKTTLGRVVSVACGALLLTGCGSRTVPLQRQEAWFACENRRECIILEDPTCTLIPVNRRHVESLEDWVRVYQASELASGPCNPQRIQYEATCEAERCSSRVVIPDTADASREESR